ncbi:BTB/POZ domain-containing protein 16 [Tachysurus ichikawai]
MCVGLSGRQRRQTGHTNRCQLAPPLPGDLLGQSQLERATKSGIYDYTPHRSTKSDFELGVSGAMSISVRPWVSVLADGCIVSVPHHSG